MDKEIKEEFDRVWKAIKNLRWIRKESLKERGKLSYTFPNKVKKHNKLLEKLLKSSFCHSRNGLTQEEILEIFRENKRPVVPKKISDLLHVWKKRKRIDAVKTKGEKQLRSFWIQDDETEESN